MNKMAFPAPVIGQVTGTVFNDTQAQALVLYGLPERSTGFALVFGLFNAAPVNGLERYMAHKT